MNKIIIYFEVARGFEADIEDDFTVFYKFCRHARAGINHYHDVGCVAIVCARNLR